jgi:hypothetical protein
VNGCLKGLFRTGCLILVAIVLAGAWWFRHPLMRYGSMLLPKPTVPAPPVGDSTVGAPTPKSVESTQGKLGRLARPAGPDSIVLSANEVAALVGSGIDWSVRKSFDSLHVELLEGSVAVYCRLDTRVIPPDLLGPFTSMLNPMEPLRLAGPVRIDRPGTALWRIDELSVRGVAFPQPMVAMIARRMAGADSSGAVPLRVSPAFRDVAIHPSGVVLYRTRRKRVAS